MKHVGRVKRLLVFLVIAGCGMPLVLRDGGLLDDPDAGQAMNANDSGIEDAGTSGDGDAGSDAGSATDAGSMADAGTGCPPGLRCVATFPFTDMGDTSDVSLPSQLNGYSCGTQNEGGREIVWRVEVPFDGFLSAAVNESNGVDVDVHILSALDAQQCLHRGNFHAKADVTAGTYFIVVDTFVSGGVPQAGTFTVDIGFTRPSSGACELRTGVMPRVNDMGNSLPMPATGQMAVEAHLVTQDEPPPYPSSSTEELAAHYALSQARTGFVMHRTQVWAPLEGGSFYGAGIGSPTLFPLLDEGWYVNMYWQSSARPARGTKMILRMPNTTRAVVVAAGYETGPGNLSFIGGTPEETHFYFGTTHGSVMQLGIAVDQTIPFGPRTCVP